MRQVTDEIVIDAGIDFIWYIYWFNGLGKFITSGSKPSLSGRNHKIQFDYASIWREASAWACRSNEEQRRNVKLETFSGSFHMGLFNARCICQPHSCVWKNHSQLRMELNAWLCQTLNLFPLQSSLYLIMVHKMKLITHTASKMTCTFFTCLVLGTIFETVHNVLCCIVFWIWW